LLAAQSAAADRLRRDTAMTVEPLSLSNCEMVEPLGDGRTSRSMSCACRIEAGERVMPSCERPTARVAPSCSAYATAVSSRQR
jgi:hypothetical protein